MIFNVDVGGGKGRERVGVVNGASEVKIDREKGGINKWIDTKIDR